jgi:hypothetical protein
MFRKFKVLRIWSIAITMGSLRIPANEWQFLIKDPKQQTERLQAAWRNDRLSHEIDSKFGVTFHHPIQNALSGQASVMVVSFDS